MNDAIYEEAAMIEAEGPAVDPPIRRHVERLEKELANLDHSFAMLADRLAAILAPESSDVQTRGADPEPPMSDLARFVLRMAEQAGRIAAGIDDVRHRVEC